MFKKIVLIIMMSSAVASATPIIPDVYVIPQPYSGTTKTHVRRFCFVWGVLGILSGNPYGYVTACGMFYTAFSKEK